MRFSSKKKIWEIVDMSNVSLAFYNETSDFPFGSRRWYFLDNNCTDPAKPWRTLNLHEATDQPGLNNKYFENICPLMRRNISDQEISVVTMAVVSSLDMCATM